MNKQLLSTRVRSIDFHLWALQQELHAITDGINQPSEGQDLATGHNRLTEYDEFGNANIVGVDGADLALHLPFDQFNKVTEALNKLAEYEDKDTTKHGMWDTITRPDNYLGGVEYSDKCPVCGYVNHRSIYGRKLNYCPECGLKMDGGNSSEQS